MKQQTYANGLLQLTLAQDQPLQPTSLCNTANLHAQLTCQARMAVAMRRLDCAMRPLASKLDSRAFSAVRPIQHTNVVASVRARALPRALRMHACVRAAMRMCVTKKPGHVHTSFVRKHHARQAVKQLILRPVHLMVQSQQLVPWSAHLDTVASASAVAAARSRHSSTTARITSSARRRHSAATWSMRRGSSTRHFQATAHQHLLPSNSVPCTSNKPQPPSQDQTRKGLSPLRSAPGAAPAWPPPVGPPLP